MLRQAGRNDRHMAPHWVNIMILSIFHLGAIAALFAFSWKALVFAVFLWWITGSLGIGMGYHRLLTHRGFKTSKPIEYLLTFFGSMALQGGPIAWVATHRIHHAFTDRAGDPHSPRDGGWWSHAGWILIGKAQQHDRAVVERFVPDLTRESFHVWLDRFYWLPTVVSGLLLLGLGGWSFLLWALFFRVTYGLHITWLVNSATHLWGKRRYDTRDDSRNSLWVALLTFGEGWHNNHHAHPSAARHGMTWYEIDMNWWCIRALEMLHLATAVKVVSLDEKSTKPRALRAA